MLQQLRVGIMMAGVFGISGAALVAHAQQTSGQKGTAPQGRNVDHVTVTHLKDQSEVQYPWGAIRWLMNGKIDADAGQTFGVVRINAGQKNALHIHPNCEELLYVLSGDGETSVGDKTVPLHPGDLVRIPPGVLHQATVTGTTPLIAVISYSSPDRQVINYGSTKE